MPPISRRAVTATLMSLVMASTAGQEAAQEVPTEEVCRAAEVLPLKLKLNNGVEVPRIGFGTAGLGHLTEETVSFALEAGYRSLDTAQAWEWYQEDAVGRAVKRSAHHGAAGDGVAGPATPAEADGLSSPPARPFSREELFVTTKIHPRDFGSERLRSMLQTSRMNLDGVDLLLLHSPYCWPGACPDTPPPTPWQEAWRSLEEIYAEGGVRAIGVSNFSEHLLRELLAVARVVPAVVQNWMDPFHQDRAVRSLCAETGIAYVAYSTLGGQWTYRSSPPPPNPVSTNGLLGGIAEAHSTTPQAVAFSWALQSGAVVLPRSSNAQRIRDNLHGFLAPDAGNCVARTAGESVDMGTAGREEAMIALFLSEQEMNAIADLDGTLGN